MTLYEHLALSAVFGFVAFGILRLQPAAGASRGIWLLPAGLSAAFLAFSLLTIAQEGVLGFWSEHTRSLWGNQIWFDLLLAAGVCWALIVPRARAVGMQPVPWFVVILLTGSIGILAMVARLLQLEASRMPS